MYVYMKLTLFYSFYLYVRYVITLFNQKKLK